MFALRVTRECPIEIEQSLAATAAVGAMIGFLYIIFKPNLNAHPRYKCFFFKHTHGHTDTITHLHHTLHAHWVFWFGWAIGRVRRTAAHYHRHTTHHP